MQIKIMVRVSTYPDSDKAEARVRKVILNDAGDKVVSKSILSSYGEWIEMEDNAKFPEYTKFEVQIHELAPDN